MSPRDAAGGVCPYVGLQPFEEGDRDFFFGRERDQRIIIANLLASPLTILYGASGVGKSSVLMAGVAPQLRKERPKNPLVVFRSWVDRDFQVALTRACIDAAWSAGVDQPKPAESLPFDEVLRACGEAARDTVLLILDQFEEYFLYHPKSLDPESFEAQFARAVNRDDVDVGVLIALREDSLARLDRFQERIPNLLSNRLRLRHLDAGSAAAAIRRPLDAWNARYATDRPPMRIEDALVDELIEQVRIGRVSAERHGGSGGAREGGQFVEAPFLQLVMLRLWDEEIRAGSTLLRRETLDRLAGATEIVRAHLDAVMNGLDPAGQALCASFFDRLVTPTGGKIACRGEDLAGWAGHLAPSVPAILEVLSSKRILRTVAAPDDPEATGYEIFHDVLARPVLDWRRRYMEDRQRAEAVQEARKQAAQRAVLKWLVALAAMAVLAFTGGVVASWQWLRAEANQKAAQSTYASTFDTASGLALGLAAVGRTALLGLKPTPAAEDALRQATQASRLEWTLRVDARARDLAFSPDGRRLAVAGEDKAVRIWDIADGPPRPTPFTALHDAKVGAVAFLPAGDRLVTAANQTAYLWAIDDPTRPLRSFEQPSPIHGALAVSRNGHRLATAGGGDRDTRKIRIWDLEAPSPEPLATIDVAGAWVMGLAFTADGSCLAAVCVERGRGKRNAAGVWCIEDAKEVLSIPIGEPSDAVVFTPDGTSLVTASRDTRVRLWQPAGEALDTVLAARCGSASRTGTAAPARPAAVMWKERIMAGHIERVRNVAVSPDGSRIASAGGDGTVKIWDAQTGENLLTLAGHKGPVEAVEFSPDGHHVASASLDATVRLWNVEGHVGAVTSLAFSADGASLVTGSSDRTARLWHLSNGVLRLDHTLTGHVDQVYRVAFDPTGEYVATAGFDNTVKLWSVESGREVASLRRHDDQLRGVAFSRDGTRLASVGADGAAWLYDVESGDIAGTARRVVHYGSGKWAQASAVAFHPQRDEWVTAGWDGTLQLWDYAGTKLGTIVLGDRGGGIARHIVDLAFSPDGTTIAALTQRRVYLWPVTAFGAEGPTEPAIIQIDDERVDLCSAIAYRSDGRELAIGCDDGGGRIVDMDTRRVVKTITVHRDAVSDVAFSPDGKTLATASLDKTFHVSPLDFEALHDLAKRLQTLREPAAPAR